MEYKMILATDVLKAISDMKSLALFRIVATARPDSHILISKTKLARRQYYSRMSSLMNAGLIKRKNGKHTLTAFGKVIYDIFIIRIESATNFYLKLKAIDSLEMSNDLTVEERKNLIDSLIENPEIKTVLISNNSKFYHKSYINAVQQERRNQLTAGLLLH